MMPFPRTLSFMTPKTPSIFPPTPRMLARCGRNLSKSVSTAEMMNFVPLSTIAPVCGNSTMRASTSTSTSITRQSPDSESTFSPPFSSSAKIPAKSCLTFFDFFLLLRETRLLTTCVMTFRALGDIHDGIPAKRVLDQRSSDGRNCCRTSRGMDSFSS